MHDAASPPPIHLRLHGAAAWCHGGGPTWQALERKQAALLTWLWLEGATPRSRLAGLLWPQVTEERARGNLRQRLLKLRQEAGDLVVDSDGLLALAPGVVVQPAEPAVTPLLAALDFDDCEAFSRWLEGRREAERERRKRAWLAEVREAAQGQRLDDALYAADQLLQADRESEEAYRVLMEVYYLRGDRAAALSAWDRCRDMLRQIYGVPPSAATQQLGQSILESDAQAQATQQAWAPTPSATQHLPAAVLRPPVLVGRDAALQDLAAGWHAGHVLVIAGAAGVGKSRLLGEWQARALAQATAATGARPGDALLPYASLSRLLLVALERFKPALDTPHALQAARLLPRLAALAGVVAEPVRTEYERAQALRALARLLGDCTRAGCAALVFDDLQFADPASLAALRVLALPAESEAPGAQMMPLRFAFGVRADEAGAEAAALLDALAATGRCTRVDLRPLSVEQAADLLSSLHLTALDAPAWAAQLWHQVGGNPAFLLESVKLLLSTESAAVQGASLPLPASIDAVIQRRLELLSPRARHLAQLAAIAGSSYSIPLAAHALACVPLELSEPLRELELRQIFYGRQFVHDVIASVTERSVPATVAEFMHRFVAEHLTRHGADPAEVAVHWQACAEWRRAGQGFVQAAQAARAAALANEHAMLLDRAIEALEHDPAAHHELFDAVVERASAYESQGHEGLRPQFIARLQALARTEAQRLAALIHHNGWLTNLAKPVDEGEALRAIDRARAVSRPDLAWQLAYMLGSQWGMNNRADEGLALLKTQEAWIESDADLPTKAMYRLTRSSIHAYGDRLPEAIAEGRQALAAFAATQDWPNALPAMSNLGVMHYWRGEYEAAHDVLAQARAQREKLYGNRGSGIKIDIHLGGVLYELGRHADAQDMLEGARAEILTWPDNEYRRTECLLADNHLAQMFIALGRADDAARVLAHDATGVADRFYGRRLTLRLRWQRVFGQVDPALKAELQELAARVASPFNRMLMTLELARHLPPAEALAAYRGAFDSPVAGQRPGLQLHAAVLAAHSARCIGDAQAAERFDAVARDIARQCGAFDMPADEVRGLLQRTALKSCRP